MVNRVSNMSSWIESSQFDWSPYLRHARQLSLRKHTCLFHQDDPATTVYALLSGRVRLCLFNETGEEKAMVVVGRNGLVGETNLFSGTGCTVTAVTATDSQLLAFECEIFNELFVNSPILAKFVLRNVNQKFQILSQQTIELSYASAQYRVIRLLVELAETYGSVSLPNGRIGIQFTQQEMANLAGTTRVTVAQVFSLLERRGLMYKENGYLCFPLLQHVKELLSDPKLSHTKYTSNSRNSL